MPGSSLGRQCEQEGGANDGMLLVGTARGVYVCRLLPEGRLAVVHSLPRPVSAREGCLPSAAWRLRPPEAGRPASALLAVAWDADVEVHAVPLRPPARALITMRVKGICLVFELCCCCGQCAYFCLWTNRICAPKRGLSNFRAA